MASFSGKNSFPDSNLGSFRDEWNFLDAPPIHEKSLEMS